MNTQLKFEEIYLAQWSRSSGTFNTTVYGLGKDGRLYVLRRGVGWIDAEEDAVEANTNSSKLQGRNSSADASW